MRVKKWGNVGHFRFVGIVRSNLSTGHLTLNKSEKVFLKTAKICIFSELKNLKIAMETDCIVLSFNSFQKT